MSNFPSLLRRHWVFSSQDDRWRTFRLKPRNIRRIYLVVSLTRRKASLPPWYPAIWFTVPPTSKGWHWLKLDWLPFIKRSLSGKSMPLLEMWPPPWSCRTYSRNHFHPLYHALFSHWDLNTDQQKDFRLILDRFRRSFQRSSVRPIP